MTRHRTNLATALRGLVLTAVVSGGCITGGSGPRPWSERARFPEGGGEPTAVVYGGLSELLPSYDAASPLERWLYGPSDYGRTALRNPQGMAFVAGQLLVCDQGEPDVIAIHLATGKTVPWNEAEHRPRCPVDITTDARGRVYVADTTLRSVICYDADGTFLEELKPVDTPDRRFRPCAVLAIEDTLYVGDLGERQVARWDMAGRQWLAPLVPPPGRKGLIAPTGIAAADDGTLLIADAVQGMVFRVAPDGEWLRPLGRPGRGRGEFVRPKQDCTTRSGLLLVSDAGRQSVLVFDREGNHVLEIHETADGWSGWTLPTGLLAIDPDVLHPLAERGGLTGPVRPDEWVLVSDPLSARSLTLLGIVAQSQERSPDGG